MTARAEGRQELRPHLRDEPAPGDAVVVIRGGPVTLDKLAEHARRTHAAFVLDGEPLWGVSVFCAVDDIGPASLEGLLGGRLASFRVVHLPTVSQLVGAGFNLLPTFNRPHYTLRVAGDTEPELTRLLGALGPEGANPYHGGRRPGRRRR